MNWQPIETAPKDGRDILIVRAGKEEIPSYRVVYWDEEGGEYPWHVDDSAKGFSHHKNFPTHWTSLPEPPNAVLTGAELRREP